MIRYRLVHDGIGASILRYAAEFKKGLREITRNAARGVTRRVIDITPPANQGATGADAYRAGRTKIASQMSSVLAPVRLKGRRQITTVFGHRPKRRIIVPTKERWPDVAGIYRNNLHASRNGVGLRLNNHGQKYYVDIRKFQAVLKERQANVGKLAAGWAAGASALDVPLQAWISRHGTSGGRVKLDVGGERMRITVENLGDGLPGGLRSELGRRIPYAVQYQADAMGRAIDGYHKRTRRELGIAGA